MYNEQLMIYIRSYVNDNYCNVLNIQYCIGHNSQHGCGD